MKNPIVAILGQPSEDWGKLPVFLKFFCYYFLLSGVFMLFSMLFQVIGLNITIGIYGLKSKSLLTLTGSIVLIIYILKFFIAWGFYKGVRWIKNVAIFDAIFGILVGLFIVFSPIYFDKPLVPHVFSSELFFLIPYLCILLKKNTSLNELVTS